MKKVAKLKAIFPKINQILNDILWLTGCLAQLLTTSLSMLEVMDSIPGPIKSAQHRQRLGIPAMFHRSPGAQPRRCAPSFITRFGVIP